MVILGYITTFAWVFLVMGLAQGAKRLLSVSAETSRKIVHVLVSFAWIPMYFCFGSSWHLIVPPLCFVVINYISVRKNVFSMMERDGGENRSYGTVYYALSMAVMAAASALDARFLLPYGIGMFCMSFGDGLAPLVGGIAKGNIKLLGGKKTVFGSASVCVLSLLVVIVMSASFSMELAWYECVLIALLAMVMELLGSNGFDNLTLPLGTSLLSYIFITL